jgi:hypothetical protein
MRYGQQETTTRQLLTPQIVAAMLDVHPDTLARWRRRGDGPPFVKLGTGRTSAIRYRREDVDTYIEANVHESTSSLSDCA